MLGKVKSRRTVRHFQSAYCQLETQVMSHPAWRGNFSLSEATNMLLSHAPFTFVLSAGFDRYHYILSYVSPENKVKHKNIRIISCGSELRFQNGGPYLSHELDTLIPQCLCCSAEVFQPLAD